jgi:hypothetical protein
MASSHAARLAPALRRGLLRSVTRPEEEGRGQTLHIALAAFRRTSGTSRAGSPRRSDPSLALLPPFAPNVASVRWSAVGPGGGVAGAVARPEAALR